MNEKIGLLAWSTRKEDCWTLCRTLFGNMYLYEYVLLEAVLLHGRTKVKVSGGGKFLTPAQQEWLKERQSTGVEKRWDGQQEGDALACLPAS